jgi:Tfp pilus assembly protein PilE
MQRKRQRGFGLGLRSGVGDMLWTLAIIGVLVAIAIPAYSDYAARSRVNDGLAAAGSARAAVEKTFAAKGPTDMSRRANTGWMPPAFKEHLQSLAIARDGTITVRFTDAVAPQAENQVQIVPVSGGAPVDLSQAASAGRKFEWQCGGPAGKTTLPEKFRPTTCR